MQKLRGECDDRKSEANALFSSARYEDAINVYEDAVALCPHYLDYELAVLKSNIAACHLKLEQWKEAVGSATAALDGLDRFEKNDSKPGDAPEDGEGEASTSVPEEADEEIVSPGAQKRASCAAQESPQQHAGHRGSWEDVLRIKAKALMRRARARSELGGWSNLAGAEEDYKLVSTLPGLGVADKRVINAQLRELPRRTTQAREKEMGEMWGKLKDVSDFFIGLGLGAPAIPERSFYTDSEAAWQRYIEAIRSQNRQLSNGKRREDRRIQHELPGGQQLSPPPCPRHSQLAPARVVAVTIPELCRRIYRDICSR